MADQEKKNETAGSTPANPIREGAATSADQASSTHALAAQATSGHASAPPATSGHASIPPGTSAHASSAPGSSGHGHGHGHGLAHTTPVWLLVGILGVLVVLTVVTVAVTSFDLGAQGNLVVAMVIATIKAALVVAFFMHLVWDKKLHLILFLTSVLFLILFLSLSVNDRGEYEPDIQAYEHGSR